MSKTANYQRMERLIREYHQSGQSQAAFARAHSISEGQLYYWLRKFSKPASTEQDPTPEPTSGFIPLTATAPDREDLKPMIIRLGEDITIEIPVSCLR